MRIAASDTLSAGAVVAIGLGLVLTAFSGPQDLLTVAPVLTAVAAVVILAALVLRAAERRRDAARDEARNQALQSQMATLEGKVRAQAEQLRDMKVIDEVTGVLKRAEFLKRLDETAQRAVRTGRPCALLLVGVQGFREINTRHGRLEGDEVLRKVTRALQSVTRGSDVIGRWGADEFAVALGECEDPNPIVRRLHAALEGAGAGRDGRPVHVHTGGTLLRHPSQKVSPGDLVQTATETLVSISSTEGSGFRCEVLEGGGTREPVSTGG